LEAQIGKHLDGPSKLETERIISLICAYKLPATIPGKLEFSAIRQHLIQDKKITDGMLKLPVLTSIGKSKIEELPWDRIVSYMDQI